MLISGNLQKKVVSFVPKQGHLLFKGQATKHTTVKWPIEDLTKKKKLMIISSSGISVLIGLLCLTRNLNILRFSCTIVESSQ